MDFDDLSYFNAWRFYHRGSLCYNCGVRLRMNLRERKKLYKKAIVKWGHTLQLIILMEEAAELIQATSKVLRKGDKKKSVWQGLAEEIADVEIMIEQIKLSTDWQRLEERVEAAKQDKLLRLKFMLKKSGNEKK